MGSVPGLPSNPSALVCDTSSLVQVFAADMAKLLHLLKVRYRVQPVIVEAVEGELPGVLSRRHPDKVASFEKSLRKGTIRILDEALLRELHGGPAGTKHYEAINRLGDRYFIHVQRGEAYTHAAADVLGLPPLTNDFSAINNLAARGIRLNRPIIRSFDVFGLGVQTAAVSMEMC
jgi:hypothetical protein